ncbi:hypothetical protein HMPREF9021_02174 [Simonsiella muelleri ATCC 29453]|uniref:Uncharacterized protein n=1 Tax=Simonsiella muelleri ATCC 29453 TaxID=641147 RepID=V9H5F6_9NEIS|nr:hypothetical protein HMPREF9021_02174 [Simonsiella muelleri ATCC 29453]
MFENPIILVVIVVAIALLAGAFFIQKNKQSGNGGRGRSSSGRGRDVEDDDDDEEEDDDDEEDGAEDEHWGSSGTTANSRVDDTKVSVQEVDPLNEFNVYKQFGYYEKAAESLSVYMKNYPDKVTPKLVGANDILAIISTKSKHKLMIQYFHNYVLIYRTVLPAHENALIAQKRFLPSA